MNIYVKVAIGVLVAAGLGYAFGRYAQPARVEIKKEIEIQEKEVVKHDTVIVEKETKLPDGTVVKEKRTEDKTVESRKSDSKEKESTLIVSAKPQWRAGALAGYDLNQFKPVYGGEVERRILGPIFVGVWANTQSTVGAKLSIEF